MLPTPRLIDTRHGPIAVRDTASGGAALLFIHGNSSSSRVFAHQFAGPLAARCRLLAIDLPGHGASPDATSPETTYTMPAYAEAAADVLQALEISRPVVMGWSLGGHIGIELTHLVADMQGLVITGTPPSGPGADTVLQAFARIPELSFTGEEIFGEREVATYSRFIYSLDRPIPAELVEAVRRTDGRARRIMFGDFLSAASRLHDQIATVATWPRPLAVIQGGDEPFMALDYFDRLHFANLWRGAVQVIPKTGHAPFWEEPAAYDALLGAFLDDLGL